MYRTGSWTSPQEHDPSRHECREPQQERVRNQKNATNFVDVWMVHLCGKPHFRRPHRIILHVHVKIKSHAYSALVVSYVVGNHTQNRLPSKRAHMLDANCETCYTCVPAGTWHTLLECLPAETLAPSASPVAPSEWHQFVEKQRKRRGEERERQRAA